MSDIITPPESPTATEMLDIDAKQQVNCVMISPNSATAAADLMKPPMSESPSHQSVISDLSAHSPVRSPVRPNVLSNLTSSSPIMSPFVPRSASSPKFTSLKPRLSADDSAIVPSPLLSQNRFSGIRPQCVFYFSDTVSQEKDSKILVDSKVDSDYESMGKGVFEDNASHDEHEGEKDDSDDLQKMVNEYWKNGNEGDEDLSDYENKGDKNDFKTPAVEDILQEIGNSGFVHTTLNHFDLNSSIPNGDEDKDNFQTRMNLKRKLDLPLDSGSSSGASSCGTTPSPTPTPSPIELSPNQMKFLNSVKMPDFKVLSPLPSSSNCSIEELEDENEGEVPRKDPDNLECVDQMEDDSVISLAVLDCPDDDDLKNDEVKPKKWARKKKQTSASFSLRRSSRNRISSVRYSDEKPVYQWVPEVLTDRRRPGQSLDANIQLDDDDVIRLPVLVGKTPKSKLEGKKLSSKSNRKLKLQRSPIADSEESEIKEEAEVKPRIKTRKTRLRSNASPTAATSSVSNADGNSCEWKEVRKSTGVQMMLSKRFPRYAFGKIRFSPRAEKSDSLTKFFIAFNVIRGRVLLRQSTGSIFDNVRARKAFRNQMDKSDRKITESIYTVGDQFEVEKDMEYSLTNLDAKHEAEVNFTLIND